MTKPLAVDTARPSPPCALVRPCITTRRLDGSPSSGSAGTFEIRLGDRLILHRRDAVPSPPEMIRDRLIRSEPL
jgi:hypothetical protein